MVIISHIDPDKAVAKATASKVKRQEQDGDVKENDEEENQNNNKENEEQLQTMDDDELLADFDVDASQLSCTQETTVDSTTKPPAAKRAKTTTSQETSFNNSQQDVERTLQTYFGYDHLRDGQYEAIAAALEGKDVAVFWATGSGKSLCYQIPALHSGKITVVVSPLISLMQDQVHKLNHGLVHHNNSNSNHNAASTATATSSTAPLATYLGSGQLDNSQQWKALRGDFRLIYVTPEKLQTNGFLDRLSKLDVGLIAIDESHCVRSVLCQFPTNVL